MQTNLSVISAQTVHTQMHVHETTQNSIVAGIYYVWVCVRVLIYIYSNLNLNMNMHFISFDGELSTLFSVSRKCASAKCNIIPASTWEHMSVFIFVYTVYTFVCDTESRYLSTRHYHLSPHKTVCTKACKNSTKFLAVSCISRWLLLLACGMIICLKNRT